MAIDEKFTGVAHKHDPVTLTTSTRKQAQRLVGMLEMLEEHTNQPAHTGLVMVALTPGGARIILCKGCLEIARQELLDTAGILEDLIAHPVDD